MRFIVLLQILLIVMVVVKLQYALRYYWLHLVKVENNLVMFAGVMLALVLVHVLHLRHSNHRRRYLTM